jgi:hypothetical protein
MSPLRSEINTNNNGASCSVASGDGSSSSEDDESEQGDHLEDIPLRISCFNTVGRKGSKSPSNSRTSSCNSLQSLNELFVDLESQQMQRTPVQTLTDQSKRLTKFMAAKTEMADFSLHHPDPKSNIVPEKETSGLEYWIQEAAHAKEHGGDYSARAITALRAALGSAATFASMVIPQQDVLGAVCIGNIWMHVNLQSSFGASLQSVIGFARSVILTTIISWPVAFLLSHVDHLVAQILLPIFVSFMTFFIMSSPQLTSNNLMLIVMYLVLCIPLTSSKMIWWKPL